MRLMTGDVYIGRGSRQRGLGKSRWCNPFKVATHGRNRAIELFSESLASNVELPTLVWTLSGTRLVCHCTPNQDCHADSLIALFRTRFPQAYDRTDPSTGPPSSEALLYLATLREEKQDDGGSSADDGAPPENTGWYGMGVLMMVGTGYTAREFCDGQTLASPGRWPVEMRRYPSNATWVTVAEKFMSCADLYGPPRLLMDLALGKVSSSPFSPESIAALKFDVVSCLASQGISLMHSDDDRKDVPIDYRFLQLLLTAAQDPEVHLGNFSSGVRVGPGARLPRLPALYLPKKKWRLPQQMDPSDYVEPEADADTVWRQNYSTLAEHADKVIEVMEDQASRGQVLKLTTQEARQRFPNVTIASLGANRKDKPGGVVSARVLFDGTNGIAVNSRTRIRDQERAPVAADLKRSMREKASRGLRTFALTADVSEAHRQVPIAERDWHLLRCGVVDNGPVYINTVGTFGVASASYYWSRVASSIGRLTQYLAGNRAESWHLLVADDFHLESAGESYRSALLVFFVLCAVSGVPLAWSKTAGGDNWVGFELLHRSFQVGISARRAEWFSRWTRETASADHIHIGKFEEGLGRVMYVVGALEFERPFLGPLYKFMSIHPRNSVRRVPAYVSFILRYLDQQIQKSRHYSCATELHPMTSAPRVDAQASLTRTGIGGWLPVLGPDGRADPSLSTWFSLEILEDDWPWIFKKGGKPSPTLEALAVLMALKLFHGSQSARHRTQILVCPTWTDNRGNAAALNRLMTTKFPASAVVMELAAFMKKELIKAQVEWSPRSGNIEADAIANGVHEGFDPRLRLDIDPSSLSWEILPEALKMGEEEAQQMRGWLAKRADAFNHHPITIPQPLTSVQGRLLFKTEGPTEATASMWHHPVSFWD